MKKTRKTMCLVLAACMMMSLLCGSAFAEEPSAALDNGVALAETDVCPLAEDVPTQLGTLPYKATITNLCDGCGTYTRSYFLPSGTDFSVTGTIKAVGNLNDQSRTAELSIYEVGSNKLIDTCYISQFVGSTTFSYTFSNCSTNQTYYFEFRNTTPGLWVSNNITGSFTIS